jgi:hypothetical protein
VATLIFPSGWVNGGLTAAHDPAAFGDTFCGELDLWKFPGVKAHRLT